MKKKLKKQVNVQPSVSTSAMDSGFSNLVDMYTVALEDNSALIAAMLNELSTRQLTEADKASLKNISKDLKKIDKSINKLGK